jgi:starch phosphorylase
MHAAYLPRTLPDALNGLVALALDLRWSWFHGHDRLWRSIDAELWTITANPWLLLQKVSDQRLQELASDA